jgi:hypothetical protein
MEKLTPEQEDLINDCHEKKLMEEDEMMENEKLEKSRIKKTTYINPEKLNEILIRIGRKKQNSNKEVKNNGNGKTKLL